MLRRLATRAVEGVIRCAETTGQAHMKNAILHGPHGLHGRVNTVWRHVQGVERALRDGTHARADLASYIDRAPHTDVTSVRRGLKSMDQILRLTREHAEVQDEILVNIMDDYTIITRSHWSHLNEGNVAGELERIILDNTKVVERCSAMRWGTPRRRTFE